MRKAVNSYHRRSATDGQTGPGKASRHDRGYGSAWERTRRLALVRDGYLCLACAADNRTTVATEVDHITPKHKGGTDDLDNLQSLCTECHAAKTLRDTGKRARPRIGLDGWPEA